MQVAIILL